MIAAIPIFVLLVLTLISYNPVDSYSGTVTDMKQTNTIKGEEKVIVGTTQSNFNLIDAAQNPFYSTFYYGTSW
jgi:hypothetical protein